MRDDIQQDLLKELLTYNPDTGEFFWNVSRGRVKAGDGAGYTNPLGYIKIRVNKIGYYAHRLAWLYMTGVWPAEEIDHKDGDTSNNRWKNLRKADRILNSRNQGIREHNSSGFNGVHWDKSRDKWMAFVRVGGRMINLGRFDDIEDAKRAREKANKKYGFTERHGQVA